MDGILYYYYTHELGIGRHYLTEICSFNFIVYIAIQYSTQHFYRDIVIFFQSETCQTSIVF